MGIPLFGAWLHRKYPQVFTSVLPLSPPIDIMCIDFNAMVYPCVQVLSEESNTEFEKDVIVSVIKDVFALIEKYRPKRTVIAVDGVCPRAKMVQQRFRRFMSANKKKPWDTNAITPGTLFMKKMDEELYKLSSDTITVSGSDEPGEGEHKIIRLLASEENKRIMVCGLDADLIVLTMPIALKNDVTVRRENKRVSYMSTNILVQCLVPSNKNKENHVHDLILLFSLLGNDFLPGLKCLENMRCDKILEKYKEYLDARNPPIVGDKKINGPGLRSFFKLLIPHERTQCSRTSVQETYAYYSMHDTRRVVHEYVEGLSWVLEYYLDERPCPDWGWMYKYRAAPYVGDVVRSFPRKTDFEWFTQENKPFNRYSQLMFVLPIHSMKLVNNKWLEEAAHTVLKRQYPYTASLDHMDSDAPEWCQRPFLPEIDTDVTLDVVRLLAND